MKRRKIAPIVRHIIPPFVKLVWIKEVTGLENLPKNDKPFIIVPNHSSYMDHVIVSCVVIPHINRKIHFIAKKEHFETLTQSTWHSLWTKYITFIPIDRDKGEEALNSALSYLRKGAIVLIYPEGTRTLTRKIQEGKTGTARLALAAKVPVLPIGFIGTFKILPKGKKIPKLKKATMNIGKLMYFDEYYGKKVTRSLLRKITNDLMKEIARLSNQKYNF
tara:strand:- start:7466 stop:8122 length:657 start_codon:yes stop_codon:yes gene_type:complete